ncbi:MAG: LAGLIDADG family homing endonuclease, partial [Candidatus Aenigmarchaeota archaeon]|nr:LAGLIDADG family homing endonuclease [Candidatus Aenigmarchaeota archaeon]
LTTLFGSLEGDSKHVPAVILGSCKKSKASFLRALFDDEATSPKSHSIRLEMANEGIVESARNMLFEFGIQPGRIKEIDDPNSKKLKYNFYVSGFYDLKTFNSKIGFDHPEKRKELINMLKSYRHIQYKPGEVKELIIQQLKEKGEMSLYELAKSLNRNPTAKFRRKVLDLEEKGIIKSRVTKNRLKIYSADR